MKLPIANRRRAGIFTPIAAAPLAAALLVASPAASARSLIPATDYSCVGRDVTVHFSSESEFGNDVPVVVITVGGEVIKQRGDNVRIHKTPLGSLVTVQHGSPVPDSHSDSLTLLAPDVNLSPDPATEPTQFMTTLFSTRTVTGIGGPQFVAGVIQHSNPEPVYCTAGASSLTSQ
jgi:hypothetical protein